MSTASAPLPEQASGWELWKSQVTGLLKSEVRKAFLRGRALPLYLLAGMPVTLTLMWALLPVPEEVRREVGNAAVVFAGAYQAFILHVVVFLGCLLIFTNLFRGEMLERSLHYYFLCPIRREVLVVGKYLAGQIAACTIFGVAVAASYIFMFLPYGQRGFEYLTWSPGIGHILAYLGVTVLGCMGYGAVFLLVGLLFRNPIVPGILIFGWEVINPFLPAALQKISVIHYLISLCPVPASSGNFRFIVDPAPAWLSVPGIILVTAGVLYLVAWKLKRTEITYSDD